MPNVSDFDLKERVRAAVDIVDVVGAGLELRPQGRNFVARCPWHNDRRPSMTVNPERGTWKCWVCDIGGDVFSFVMQRDGVDFPTAVRQLAEQAGIEVDEMRRGPQTKPGQPDDRETLFAAIENITAAYQNHLANPSDQDAKIAADYLAERGIDDTMRKQFRIGFAPDQWSWAVDKLASEDVTGAVAAAAGLASPRKSGDGFVDMFRGRLMFPIMDLQNRPISMGGRLIPQIAQRHGERAGGKYINGRETLLFKKSQTLYGLPAARDAIRQSGVALVMEGYTDVIAAHAAGVTTAVAVLGTALTPQHVKLLRRFTEKVVLVLDGDAAGRRRADEVLELFVGSEIDLRILTLPDGSDPADYIADHGADGLMQLVAAAPDALDHKLQTLVADVDIEHDTHAVAKAADTMLRIMAAAPDGLKIDQMIHRMAKQLNFESPRLSRRLQHFRSTAKEQKRFSSAVRRDDSSPVQEPVRRPPVRIEPISGIDRELFQVLLTSPDIAATAIETIDPMWLHSTAAKMLLSALQELDFDGRELNADTLLTVLENEELKNQVVTMLQLAQQRHGRSETQPREVYNAILLRYADRNESLQRNDQIKQLAAAELDEDDELKMLQAMFEQERKRHAK